MMFDALTLAADGTDATLGTTGVGGNVVDTAPKTVTGSWLDISGVHQNGAFGLTIPAQVAKGTLDVRLDYSDNASTVKETQTFPQIAAADVVNGEIYWNPLAPRRLYVRAVFIGTDDGSDLLSYKKMMAGIVSGAHRLTRAG